MTVGYFSVFSMHLLQSLYSDFFAAERKRRVTSVTECAELVFVFADGPCFGLEASAGG